LPSQSQQHQPAAAAMADRQLSIHSSPLPASSKCVPPASQQQKPARNNIQPHTQGNAVAQVDNTMMIRHRCLSHPQAVLLCHELSVRSTGKQHPARASRSLPQACCGHTTLHRHPHCTLRSSAINRMMSQ
jgi:hypothetical protein